MPCHFRAVAVDYDGTITDDDAPSPVALEAIAELRRHGRKVLLVTGRILEELRDAFPDVDRHFDALIAENGALIVIGSQVSPVGGALPDELSVGLRAAGVPFRAGQVLLATDAT